MLLQNRPRSRLLMKQLFDFPLFSTARGGDGEFQALQACARAAVELGCEPIGFLDPVPNGLEVFLPYKK